MLLDLPLLFFSAISTVERVVQPPFCESIQIIADCIALACVDVGEKALAVVAKDFARSALS
jgi:hypothetical protein